MVRRRAAARRREGQRNPLSWAGWTVAPWCMAVALLVSFVADAGQDPNIGATRLALTTPAPSMPGVLVPAVMADLVAPFGMDLSRSDPIVREARLVIGDLASQPGPDEMEPKIAVKGGAKDFPSIDRAHRTDPNVGLRPTFDARLRSKGSLETYHRAAIAFDDSDPGVPPHELVPAGGEFPGPDSVARFEPLPDGVSMTTKPSSAAASPFGGGAGVTATQSGDGATPGVGRAMALASASPAQADEIPVQIAPLPKFTRGLNGKIATGTTVVLGVVDTAPAFSAVIDQARASSEQRCLAEAIYFEARSEPEEGQAAVAQVVLNRVMSGLYPRSICGVVFQNRQRRNACQFSFACEGRALQITEEAPWTQAVRVAREVTDGATYVSDVGGSTHYHANYVAPGWSRRLLEMDRIGHHVFYKLRPGQT